MGSMYSQGHKESYKQTFGSKEESRIQAEEKTMRVGSAQANQSTGIEEEPELDVAAAVQ